MLDKVKIVYPHRPALSASLLEHLSTPSGAGKGPPQFSEIPRMLQSNGNKSKIVNKMVSNYVMQSATKFVTNHDVRTQVTYHCSAPG